MRLERAEMFADRTETVRAMEAARAARIAGKRCECGMPATTPIGGDAFLCATCSGWARAVAERNRMGRR